MKTAIALSSALLTLALLAGCDSGPKSGRGFVFPAGNMARGQKAFVDLKCYECHRVDGVADLPAPTLAPDKVVLLGGDLPSVRTYGQLVTAVIHPSYTRTVPGVGPAGRDMVMPQRNEFMTVTQLLDLVTFLQPHYRQLPPPSDIYTAR